MKKQFILLPLVGALLYVILSSYSEGPAYDAGLERTGATGTIGCGTGCHASVPHATTTVTVTLLSGGTPVTTYTPGGSYTIQISGQNTSATNSLPRFGFQVSVVKVVSGTTSSAGTFGTYPTGTFVQPLSISGATVNIWEHHLGSIAATTLVGGGTAGTSYVETIPWTAPSAGTGCITIYGVLNAVNANTSDDTADWWNNTSLVLNEAVASITGTGSMCAGATTTLSDATPCGIWSSSNSTVAAVGSGTGVVTGNSGGTATISYTAGAGNTATKTVTVNAAPPNISGTTSACIGATTTLSDAAGIGTWTSSNTGVATINLITGTATGVSVSTATITFTSATGGCAATTTFTVNPLPTAITGPVSLCPGTTSALTDAGGGNWGSSNTSVASIAPATGVITTGTPGTAAITYTLPLTGCAITTSVTVNPAPSAISGTLVVCPGFTTTLSDAGGGTWSSGNTAVATMAANVVSGISGGTSVITYTLGTGCTVTAVVTVNPLPPSINGATSVCAGLTTGLSDATSGGTWTSGNSTIATINAGTGLVTAVAGPGGVAIISYTVPVTGCLITTSVTVNPLPSAIAGALNACPGTATTLSDAAGSGTWTSNNTSVATVASGASAVTGVIAGTSTITFTLPTGCTALATVTINPLPNSISGILSLCSGTTTSLTDATGGGAWSSGSTTVATVGSAGLVTATGLFGSAPITYTLSATGCTAMATVTVNPSPGTITGVATVCSGSTTLFTDGGVGTWSSSNTTVATVSSGTVTGTGSGGTANITYTTANGCFATKAVTVNPLPGAITGIPAVCTGATTALSDTSAGGTWSSSNTLAATVNSSTGLVTGLGAGSTTSVITYLISTGCKITTTVSVHPLPVAVSGVVSECVGSTIALSDATTGGTWASNNTAVATVASGTGVVTGIGGGTAAISYTVTATGCSASKNVTVNPAPSAISGGTSAICAGFTTPLSDAGGGTWGSSSTAIATVSGTGVVTGVKGGTATITYTLPGTGCTATKTVTVNPLSPITGTTSLCAGLTSTLSDATTGGTWASSNTSVATINSSTGFVNSGTAGASIINYTLSTGCVATTTVNIVSAPSAITGDSIVCLGLTDALSDAGGGTWTSSSTAHASVSGTGVVTGIALGTASISYSLGTGCTVGYAVTVNPVPTGITGTASVCAGGSVTTLSDITAGGLWSSSNTAVATVGSSGIVTGITNGTSTISYTLATGCGAFKTVTVNPLPSAISGSDSVCIGSTTALTDAGGGTWTSSNTSVATVVGSTGVVTGISNSTAIITYTLPVTGCIATMIETVNAPPVSISGPAAVCTGAKITLSDATGSGSWTSGNTDVIVDAGLGNVTGVVAGSATITYTLSTGCSAVKAVTINPAPPAITGIMSVCAGNASALSDSKTGGTWSSSSTGIATVSGTGAITGISAGTANIIYTLPLTGCTAVAAVTVNPLPSAITGTGSICVGFTIALSDTTASGVWGTSATVATVGSGTGVVTGIAGGTAVIAYTLGTGCTTLATVTVNPLPAGITGSSAVCAGSATPLTDAAAGGSWSSSSTATASIVSGTGIATGVSAGTVIITYALPTGCEAHYLLTVNPAPAIVTGTPVMCAGATSALSDTTSGGAWSSSSTVVATVGTGTGLVAGISAGTATITYGLLTGCAATFSVSIDPLPLAISGPAHVCTGLTTSLSDGTSGGAWSSSNTTVARVGSSTGLVTGVSASTATITYSLPTGCLSVITATVNPLPLSISGAGHVCVSATTALSDGATGGTWRSSATAIATVSAAGVVSGVAEGTAIITYTLPTGCSTTIIITVNPLPDAGTITGQSIICKGTTVFLSDSVTGGTWSSSNTLVAQSSSNIIRGVSPGIATISYTVTNICGTATAIFADTVLDSVRAGIITGADSVCIGDSLVLGDTITGGIWTSSSANATISPTGTITGVTAGTVTIAYSVTTPCGTATATALITVRSCKTEVPVVPGAAEFKVYPNPSTGMFIVEIPATQNGATINIIDVLGKVIVTRVTNDTRIQKVSFDLSNIPPGSYIVKVNAGEQTYRQKIVIW